MSRARERAQGAGLGWLTTLGGAAILLACGFGVGLVAGSALEEPKLVAKSLAGGATEIPLPAQVPTAAARPAPAGPPAPEAPAERSPDGGISAPERTPSPALDRKEHVAEAIVRREAAASTKSSVPPVVSSRAPSAPLVVAPRPTSFAIQVGAFGDRAAADRLVASLRGDRLRAYVVEGSREETARFRVRVGPYPTRDQAGDEAARLKARRRLPTWVIAEGGT